MYKFKKPLIFTLILIPIAVIGGFFTSIYAFDSYSPESQAILLEQLGGDRMLLNVITAVQTVGYAVFCGFIGYILSEKIGLMKQFTISKGALLKSVIVSVIGGAALIGFDIIFAQFIPQVKDTLEAGVSMAFLIASLTYGGVIEEVLMRLFLMSLVTLILWKLFFKKHTKENIPTKVYVIANIVCALLFAAGHLPATYAMFGEITALVLLRCFLLNGGAGIIFGELYRKYGIHYAMISHALFHAVSKLIWVIVY